jgi:ADP-ribose pyrophosphatase YjhB (NUDIX family)
MENSQFVFHLDKLIQDGYIQKHASEYTLTTSGKEFANRMDTQEIKLKLQPKTTTVIACTRKNSDEETEYLIYTRHKNPFYGCQGFPTHKVWYGEKIVDAAHQGLQQECGLCGQAQLFAIRHYHVYNSMHELLEDKIMYAFRFTSLAGELISSADGLFSWVPESQITRFVTNQLEEFFELYNLLKNFNGQISFLERNHITNKF